jgi:hypothetical protein
MYTHETYTHETYTHKTYTHKTYTHPVYTDTKRLLYTKTYTNIPGFSLSASSLFFVFSTGTLILWMKLWLKLRLEPGLQLLG